MHFTYVIIPALSLLNMGVEGATIAKVLTSRHSSEAQQVRRIVHGREFRNADFGLGSASPEDKNSPVAQATRRLIQCTFAHNVASGTASSIKDPNGSGVDAAMNPDLPDYLLKDCQNDGAVQDPSVSVMPRQDKTVTDSTTSSLNIDKLPEDLLALFSPSLLDTNPLSDIDSLDSLASKLPSTLNKAPLTTLTGGFPDVLPERREDDDSDQVQEVVKELESVSTSSTDPSPLEGNSATPQPFERRFLRRKRDGGSLETNVGGKPVLQLENISTDPLMTDVERRGVDIHSPIVIPRDHKPSRLETREDIANFDVNALENTLDQSEDIGSSSG